MEISKSEILPNYLVCRVCLQPLEDKWTSLFDEFNDSTVSQKVMYIANVVIAASDGLPDKICTACLTELETAILFKRRCENSDQVLHSSFLESNRLNDQSHFNSVLIDNSPKEEKSYHGEIENDAHDDSRDALLDDKNCDDTTKVTSTIKRERIKSKSSAITLSCKECGDNFKSKCKLKVHLKTIHTPKTFTCKSCRRLFKSLGAFKRHTETYQKACIDISNGLPLRIEGEGKNRKYFCTKCSYVAESSQGFKQHAVSHSGEKPWQCTFCPKAYTQRGNLKSHIESIHNAIPKFPCHICGKLFRTRPHLISHIKTHSENKLQCDICKTYLKSKKSLVIHMLRHQDSKTYTCETCAANFYTLSELHRHKAKHIGINKKYVCVTCSRKFRDKYYLMKHLAKHDGGKKHCCDTCGRFFDSEQTLELHKKRHLETRKCPHCPQLLIDRRSLLKHVKRKHGSKLSDTIYVPNMMI